MSNDIAKILEETGLTEAEYYALPGEDRIALAVDILNWDTSVPEFEIVNADGSKKTYGDYFSETIVEPVAQATGKTVDTIKAAAIWGAVIAISAVLIVYNKPIKKMLKK
jgi:hypothetical protein